MWGGLFPYIAPLLGPLATLLLLLTVGPCIFQRILTLLKNRLDAFMAKPIQVHYQQLEMADQQTYQEATPTNGPHDDVGQMP